MLLLITTSLLLADSTATSVITNPNTATTLMSTYGEQVQAQLYSQMKRKHHNSPALLALRTGRLVVVLAALNQLSRSHFHPIHCTLLRWILASAGANTSG